MKLNQQVNITDTWITLELNQQTNVGITITLKLNQRTNAIDAWNNNKLNQLASTRDTWSNKET